MCIVCLVKMNVVLVSIQIFNKIFFVIFFLSFLRVHIRFYQQESCTYVFNIKSCIEQYFQICQYNLENSPLCFSQPLFFIFFVNIEIFKSLFLFMTKRIQFQNISHCEYHLAQQYNNQSCINLFVEGLLQNFWLDMVTTISCFSGVKFSIFQNVIMEQKVILGVWNPPLAQIRQGNTIGQNSQIGFFQPINPRKIFYAGALGNWYSF
eukprot:TRINITY_DN5722_c0_g1_i3.p1 TRINITY_DN5722_c0_g1~~TRINITY_DN5722_c0_g1_i3.p1  ORF type:complete len:207 (-),score=-8.66 TRINITY_DN5722_c0_g1_i3:565-1185(-)